MIGPAALRGRVLLPVAVFAAGSGLQVTLAVYGAPDSAPAVQVAVVAVLAVPVLLGCLLGQRVPDSPVGAALAWVGAAPAAVFAVEMWGETDLTSRPLPGAEVLYAVQLGAWVWNLAGFVALCLVFPDGLLPGRRWRLVTLGCVVTGLAVHVLASAAGAGDGRGGWPLAVVSLLVFGACLLALGAAVASLVVRYRRGDEVVRVQLRWLVVGAGTVPVLLAGGWLLQAGGASPSVAYTGFLVAMLVVIPAAVAVAVLRHDLFDVDRLLGSSLAWLTTSLISAGVFAAVVSVAGTAGADSRLGVTGAAFVAALVLLPLHRRINELVGRLVDRDRLVISARVRQFVRDVRDGTAEPEQIEELLREILADPGLRLLVRLPGDATGYVDLTGAPAERPPRGTHLPLHTGGAEVGAISLSIGSARRVRRAHDAARQARLPIEVSRLRLQLQAALRDVRASRARLMLASAEERRRLERDLHDGAQQQIVAVGMRLRSVQRRLGAGSTGYDDVDAAVSGLEATITELRRLANGIRPSQLDDGLPAALRALVVDSPIPVRLSLADVDTAELVATMMYFVVAEAYTNALKHAGARTLWIELGEAAGTLRLSVTDDGVGGAGTGSTSIRDRVASVGGALSVQSPPGGGTRITVEIPRCASS